MFRSVQCWVAVGRVVQPQDAAVVAVEQVAAGVEGDRVVVGVRAVAGRVGGEVDPGGAAVEALEGLTAERWALAGLVAARVDVVGVGGGNRSAVVSYQP